MTTPNIDFDFDFIMPMQWVLNVDAAQLGVSQRLTIGHGQRAGVDKTNEIALEPGVYLLEWDTNLPEGVWKSFYFRDHANSDSTFTNFGSWLISGRSRIVLPAKTGLHCYATLNSKPTVNKPVVAVTAIRIAPLANALD